MRKRYVIRLEMYVNAETDQEAIIFSDQIANELDKEYDGKCGVIMIAEQPFGQMNNRIVI